MNILDVGTGITALPHLMSNCGFNVTATDNVKDYWPAGMYNRHYYVIDDDITKTKITDKFDLITCISVLEHIENADIAVKNMFSLLKPHGYIVLTCPYNEKEYVSNVYELPQSRGGENAPYICQSFSRGSLDQWLEQNNASIIAQEYWQFFEGAYWTIGDEIIPPRKVTQADPHQHTCILMQNNNAID